MVHGWAMATAVEVRTGGGTMRATLVCNAVSSQHGSRWKCRRKSEADSSVEATQGPTAVTEQDGGGRKYRRRREDDTERADVARCQRRLGPDGRSGTKHRRGGYWKQKTREQH